MILNLPNEILQSIILKIDCNCINHRSSLFLSNKQMYNILNNIWFFKNIILCNQTKKNMYFEKYRKYMIKYSHLKHQIECIYINESDDSDSSISSMDMDDYLELLDEGDYIDNI